KSGVFLVAFCARLKTYGAFFGDKNHKAFSRFCLCGHEKSGLVPNIRSAVCFLFAVAFALSTETMATITPVNTNRFLNSSEAKNSIIALHI
ncbi:hypothetical protein, partial [Pseudomonas aeruginosa]|uniref:hypothetical protein n=1 Tax=Pseudomonas aeruginosa TaxID=287 RepID=UPI002F90E6EC